jgi:UDP:flavonoid glycosyltransferase YjiC (YdhE family)
MRILFTTSPGLGHFFPVVPTAWAARAGGHEVLVATAGAGLTASAQAGLPAVDAAPGFDITQVFRSRMEAGQSPMFRDVFADATVEMVAALFAEIADRMADRTVEVARWWKPDLVVHTPLDGVGPLTAGLLSVPLVEHGLGLNGVGRLALPLFEAMRPTRERHGLVSQPTGPAAVLDPCPPSLSEDDRARTLRLRYVPYNGGGPLPGWLLEPAGRRRVCVTLGSVVPLLGGLSALAGVMEAVRDLDAEIVLALGDADVAALEPLPANVRSAGWVPLSALLPTCAAVVHHGGAGTTMNALVAGVPQLVLPHGADQHMNAAAVERRGVGISHRPDAADVELLWAALRRLLHDPEIRRAVDEVRLEIAGLPPPAEVLLRLPEVAVGAC